MICFLILCNLLTLDDFLKGIKHTRKIYSMPRKIKVGPSVEGANGNSSVEGECVDTYEVASESRDLTPGMREDTCSFDTPETGVEERRTDTSGARNTDGMGGGLRYRVRTTQGETREFTRPRRDLNSGPRRPSTSIASFSYKDVLATTASLSETSTLDLLKYLIARTNRDGQRELYQVLVQTLRAMNWECSFPRTGQ